MYNVIFVLGYHTTVERVIKSCSLFLQISSKKKFKLLVRKRSKKLSILLGTFLKEKIQKNIYFDFNKSEGNGAVSHSTKRQDIF